MNIQSLKILRIRDLRSVFSLHEKIHISTKLFISISRKRLYTENKYRSKNQSSIDYG